MINKIKRPSNPVCIGNFSMKYNRLRLYEQYSDEEEVTVTPKVDVKGYIMLPNFSQKNIKTGTIKSRETNIPIIIFLKFLISSLFIKIYRAIGNIIRAVLYRAKNAIITNGNTKIKNFESFLTAKTRKYNAQIVKETLVRSENPTLRTDRTVGKVAKSNPPKKLSILLKRSFKNKQNPITPNMKVKPSTIKIVAVDTNPNLKKIEMINEKNGGLVQS